MYRRPIRFFADRYLLDGDLWLPEHATADHPVPCVVACSGYQGLKVIHPERFARALVPAGYAVVSFDYRGFGASEGERGRLVPQDQVEDVRAAVSFAETVPEVDRDRIALLGWAQGGGIAITEAADDPRVTAVATCNAIGDGYRSTRGQHDDATWDDLLARIAEDQRRAVVTGRSEIVHPFTIVRLDGVTAGYVDKALYTAPGFGSGVTLESAAYLLRFRPEDYVGRIAPRPLLLVHGERNMLYRLEESEQLYRRAGDGARLVVLEGAGHTEWMLDDHPTFGRLMDEILGFLDRALVPAAMTSVAG